MEILFFLSSGLFLGWSLGANDAANVFGTAVGTRMVSFRAAAIVCSIFIILGATISGAGAIALEFNTSVRAEGMVGAGIAQPRGPRRG